MTFVQFASFAQTPSNTLQGNMTFSYLQPCFTGSQKPVLYNYGYDSKNMTYTFRIYDYNFNETQKIDVDLSDCRTKVSNFYQTVTPMLTIYRENENGHFDCGSGICKNIFSNSNEYETIIPVLGEGKVNLPTGASTITVENPVIGFNIITASGRVIREIKFPEGYYGASYNTLNVTTYILEGNIKCLVNVANDNTETFTLVYDLGKENSSAPSLNAPCNLLHIYPSSVLQGTPVNISIDSDNTCISDVNVYSTSGQLIFNSTVNSNQLLLDTSNMPQGINLVKVSTADNTVNTAKLLIR